MPDPYPEDETPASHPEAAVLVVAYDDNSRAAIAASPAHYGVRAVACASFAEAERQAMECRFMGVMVDLTTMIKSKETEKLIAHTLTGIFPTLRVKCMGSMLIPMILSGDAKQDKSLNDFFQKTCAGFEPRTLRLSRRKDICVPVLVGGARSFTATISWTGAFLVFAEPERFRVGERVRVTLVVKDGEEVGIDATVRRIEPWGTRRQPGLGVEFISISEEVEVALAALLGSERGKDPDRLHT